MYPTRGIRDLVDVMGAIYAHATRLYSYMKTRATAAALKPHVYLQYTWRGKQLLQRQRAVKFIYCIDIYSFPV